MSKSKKLLKSGLGAIWRLKENLDRIRVLPPCGVYVKVNVKIVAFAYDCFIFFSYLSEHCINFETCVLDICQ